MKPRIILTPSTSKGVKCQADAPAICLARSRSQALLGSHSLPEVTIFSLAEPKGALSGAVFGTKITPSGFWAKARPEPFSGRGWLLVACDFFKWAGHGAEIELSVREACHG